MESLFAAYVTCALWSSTDDDGTPLDSNYSASDIDADTLAKMRADCEEFERRNAVYLGWEWFNGNGNATAQAGHDFWLTRNGHGAGFWDGDWSKPADEILTNSAESFGEFNLYIGDDGRIYGQ